MEFVSLPCGGSSPINLGFFLSSLSPLTHHLHCFLFLLHPSISTMVSLTSINKHADVFPNLDPTSSTDHFELYGYGRRPPPEPPPLEVV
ncbi:hypothetical protein QL285_088776 [Trifolium repens]|nr:hypothetical protein QL285_088776 [Trifolium repens]